MSGEALRWLPGLHGALAWAAVIALIGAAGAVFVGRARRARRGQGRGALAALAVGAALLGAAFASGVPLDLPYWGRLRQRVFLESPGLGWLFERKLHLAFGAVALAGCALGLLGAAALGRQRDAAAPRIQDMERGGRLALVACAAFALLASIAANVVTRRFPF